ncbi:MAG: anaerobic ribonucleoside-triphosphate reductase [Methanobacteriota archaeon]|nr:MAG: anaerobic ribonucleoside-triphosphate reductase [Euryarchaeota archaeon]
MDITGIKDTKEMDSTDIALFVKVSRGDVVKWNRKSIVDALLRETQITPEMAEKISIEAEKTILESGIKFITAPLIREVVNEKLIHHGLEEERKQHTRLGLPIFDVEEIITSHNKENANVPHGPEATNLSLAEAIKKQYALLKVFPENIAFAHESGDIHLHDLGMIDRPYCSGNSLEYIKKFGLNLPNALSIAKPARHPEVLIGQMIKFSAALQGTFAGAIGWDAVNLFIAPYLTGVDDRRMEQLAQILVFEFAQQAVARGGQSIFSDLNLYWEVPKHFTDVPAIGPGGEFTGNVYEDYIEEAQRFLQALMRVYLQGDAYGRPFFFPKPQIHITERLFKTEGHEEFLAQVAEVSSEKGNPYYVFDRGDTAKISECCRLAFKLEESDLNDAKTPWKMRYSAMQNVTFNLPRIAYEANGSDRLLFEILRDRMELAAQAHIHKRRFITRLLDMGNRGPLGLLAMDTDGEPYYRLRRASFLFGMLGLNEMVQHHTGSELHESVDSFKFGLKVIAFMKKTAEELSNRYGMKFVLEQTPAESTAYRMAVLDLQHYPKEARATVKGDIKSGEVYYTNSTYLNVGTQISPIERVKKEGMFHPMIEAGSLTHIWLGEARPSPESIANFVLKTFRHTTNDQIAFSPEFTSCLDCGRNH